MLSGVFGVGGNVTVGDRDSLYIQIQAIQGSTLFQATAGFTSIVAVNSLSNAAMDDTPNGYAYRYALVNLNSFAVTGNAGLYSVSEWSAENFTSEYLEDRSYMLNQLISRNAQDSVIVPETGGLREYYSDLASGYVDPALGIEAATFATLGGGIPDDPIRGHNTYIRRDMLVSSNSNEFYQSQEEQYGQDGKGSGARNPASRNTKRQSPTEGFFHGF